jgi:hypothetical protein
MRTMPRANGIRELVIRTLTDSSSIEDREGARPPAAGRPPARAS